MPGFHFRFAPLQSIRAAHRDACRAQVAEALAAQRALDDERRSLEQTLVRQRAGVHERLVPGPIDVDCLIACQRYEIALRQKLRDLAARQSEAAGLVDARQQALAAAEREVRVLEKLRQRQFESFQQTEAKSATKELDEIAGRGYRSRQSR